MITSDTTHSAADDGHELLYAHPSLLTANYHTIIIIFFIFKLEDIQNEPTSYGEQTSL
jgi:hypothetical protein